jgi:hypothetical protein|tara:strand:- start:847 stop:1155 length:309 start_codon:yes stop_codon:yes gene_type:complete
MKQNILDTMHIILATMLALTLIGVDACTNVKPNQFSAGKILQDIAIKTPDGGDVEETDIVKYASLPDWQLYDLNPSSLNYKKIYGLEKFRDMRFVIAFEQVP